MLLKGFPPKIIWLRTGNISTHKISDLINEKLNIIIDFLADKETGVLELH